MAFEVCDDRRCVFLCQHLRSDDRVQGEALLSVGEAHNNLFPVPACGEGD